ncbi:MAG: hypothetical protein J6U13_08850 [Salinivirgaceae bacterium]|nr:hypothetical protein [Salinivirgaceae bacterium]
MKTKFLTIALLCCVIAGCKPTAKTTKADSARQGTKTESVSAKKPAAVENFDKFYDRFHNDSLFQISRVKFPIEGFCVSSDTITKWSTKNWLMMRTRIYDVDTTQYKVSYNKTDKTFTERVWIENAGLVTECRFELIGGKWWLVYLQDENN